MLYSLHELAYLSAAPFRIGAQAARQFWQSPFNPASQTAIGRTLSDTFAGIRPSSAPAFIAAQLLGGALAIALARYLHPHLTGVDLVVPHDQPQPAR